MRCCVIGFCTIFSIYSFQEQILFHLLELCDAFCPASQLSCCCISYFRLSVCLVPEANTSRSDAQLNIDSVLHASHQDLGPGVNAWIHILSRSSCYASQQSLPNLGQDLVQSCQRALWIWITIGLIGNWLTCPSWTSNPALPNIMLPFIWLLMRSQFLYL